MNKALLVGMNQYPNAPLRGCVNDINNLVNYLETNKYYCNAEIRTLFDNQATTAGILDSLKWLVDVKAGDKILFHPSGHGAVVPHPDGSIHECLCPIDFDWSPERMILDEQFIQIFSAIPPGVIFTWSADSCHSGGLDREIPTPFHNPTITPRRYPGARTRVDHLKKGGAKIHTMRSMVGSLLDVGFISACTAAQTAADTEIGGKPCGAFTYYFIQALTAKPGASLSEVAVFTHRLLSTAGYEQDPVADGARANKPFLQ